MARNKNILVITLAIILIVVVVATVVKVYNNHIDSLYTVVEKRIEESARKCFIEEKCSGDKTNLGLLIKEGYITSQVNPVTKEYISEDIIITYDGSFCDVNIR